MIEPRIRGLAETLRTSWNRSFSYEPSPALVAAGYTHEMHARRKAEMMDAGAAEGGSGGGGDSAASRWEYHTDFYLLWARKKDQ